MGVLDGSTSRRRGEPGPGWSSRWPPTTRPSRPCPRSSAEVAPGGTSVEPAFELVDEGLAARVDPTRPAIVRAYLPSRDRRRRPSVRRSIGGARPSGTSRRSACGRSATSTTRLVHEADWAKAWKAHFPVLRIGRRIVIRPTWRRHRREPGDVVLALDPGMAFGTGLHPTTRLCLAGARALGDAGPRGSVGGRPASSTSAAARGSWRSPPRGSAWPRARRGRRPDRGRRDARERRVGTGSAGGSPPARAACRAARARSTSSSPTSSRRC